ncbi:MAG: PIN domain nuclease [Chloroflexi bacterium]|nr:PIN domain nuclease [Chloroflexota bacterium]
MDKVIVDTSAWIESFRPSGEAKLKEILKELISDGEIFLPGIIKTELLRGTKSKKEFQMLNELLDSLTYLSVEDDFWGRLAKFSFNLLREGITAPLTDTYIALLAIEKNAPLLHRDTHFDLIAQKTGLKILEVK